MNEHDIHMLPEDEKKKDAKEICDFCASFVTFCD